MIATNYKKNSIVIGLILLFGIIYHYQHINEAPSFIHTWANSDRYAIALGFVDNGLDISQPQTYVYNKNFPEDWQINSPTTVTAVDFPIHDYMAAVLMKILNTDEPWVFRTYQLLYSFLGLFFLFKLSYALTKNYFRSIIILVFGATSPLFVYYQISFLPTTPSLANAIIGIYFYHQLLEKNRGKYFWLSTLFLTLATLSRTTFVIPLIAVFGVELIRVIKKEAPFFKRLFPVVVSFSFIGFYFIYNHFLREENGSMFLSNLQIPADFEEIKLILQTTWKNWNIYYYSDLQYWFLLLLIMAIIYFKFRKKTVTSKSQNYFIFLVCVHFIGVLLFSYAMMKQFPAHDYYFLDSFFLPILVSVILMIAALPTSQYFTVNCIEKIVGTVLLIFFFLQPINVQKLRRSTGAWDKNLKILEAFRESATFIEQLGIPKEAKIMVIDPVSPNLPFIFMKRKGYAIMRPTKERIEQAFTWNADYIVVQNEIFYYDIYPMYPEILQHLHKIADNGVISVCTYTENNPQTIEDFVGLKHKTPYFEATIGFEDTLQNKNLRSTIISDKYAFKGKNSGKITQEMDYGFSFQIKNSVTLESANRILAFDAQFLTEGEINSSVAVTIEKGNQIVYRSEQYIGNFVPEKNKWSPGRFLFFLPRIDAKNSKLSFHFYNHGHSQFYYDNAHFRMY